MAKKYLFINEIASGVDNSDYINNAILQANDHDILFFPEGIFIINKPIIQINKFLHWKGYNSVIITTANTSSLIIKNNGTDSFLLDGFNFLNTYNGTDSNSHGLLVCGTVNMNNCSISGFGGSGISVSPANPFNANFSKFRDLIISDNKIHGMYFYGTNVGWCVVDGVHVKNNGQVGFYDKSQSGQFFTGCIAQGNKRNYSAYDPNNRSTFIGCYSDKVPYPEYLAGAATWHGGVSANNFDLHNSAKIFR